LWDYAEESARYIFGDATGDPVADAILQALRNAGDSGGSLGQRSGICSRDTRVLTVSTRR
jgi:hypothetical protein